ncbi:MAG: sigma 54-interacting transcriptional regulator [Thermodesulfobacteriota bacterium]|nr:sigma 54-interacting transcriptional regulator [Thermodesulfobacteriota bacterium]
MTIKAVIFTGDSPGKTPVRTRLKLERAQDLQNAKTTDLPTAYVVGATDLEAIRRFKDVVLDQGRQDEKVELARYLLGRSKEKTPIVHGKYKTAGTLKNGVKKLLERALEKSDQNLYVIGAEDAVFAKIWKEADHGEEGEQAQGKTGTAPAHDFNVTEVNSSLVHALTQKYGEPPKDLARKYVGQSEDAALVRLLIIVGARSDNPVLIIGDTGTGKEVVAREIHEHSKRKRSKFVPVNCSGIPSELLESELFGHMKGAYTHATSDKKGLWEVAHKGTLFLDEISDLQEQHQAKILRALESGKIRRVGATEETSVDARVIAATNRDLFSMVQAGQFREDLYYRLAGFFVRTPVLREQRADIGLIAQHCWKKITQDRNATLPQEIINDLKERDWSGNVRQLKMVLNNLHDLFGTKAPRITDLKHVFYLAGQRLSVKASPVSSDDITRHLAECLQHLKRVYESIHASNYIMRPVMEEPETDKQAVSSARQSMAFRFHELDVLCRKPLLFHRERTFSEVNALKGKISYVLNLSQKDFKQAQKYWRMEVAEAFKSVKSTVFKEIENVLAEA